MKKRTKKHLFIITVTLLTLLIGGEIYLRLAWGFCDSVLMQSDPDFEYIAQPCQNRFRFKKHVIYNEYSQRSSPVDSSAFIILGLGDSVLNGGVQTDQDSTATSRLCETLSALKGYKVQVLNISAGSWGPDNCEAYLKRFGLFNGKVAFLICSSHDAHDNINHQPVVDINSGFPSQQSVSAWGELFHRYLIPRYPSPYFKVSNAGMGDNSFSEISKDGRVFNPGFKALTSRFRQAGIPFFIWLHPERSEFEKGSYNSQGKEIIDFCKQDSVLLIEGLKYMSIDDFRDGIHVNERGQKVIAEALKDVLMECM